MNKAHLLEVAAYLKGLKTGYTVWFKHDLPPRWVNLPSERWVAVGTFPNYREAQRYAARLRSAKVSICKEGTGRPKARRRREKR